MNKKFIKKKKLSKKVQAISISLLANFPLMFFLLLTFAKASTYSISVLHILSFVGPAEKRRRPL